jgi:serine/threonine-protein kinase
MSTHRVPEEDSQFPGAGEREATPPLEAWEPYTAEPAGPETPQVIELPSPEVDPRPQAAPGVGDVLAGRYELVSLLTQGALGPVFGMFDRYIRDKESLCVLPKEASDARAQRRLERGMEAARAVRNPGVAAVLDSGEDPERGLRFVIVEAVEGMPLDRLLGERGGRLPVWEAFDIARRLCDGLEAAHRHTEHLCLNPRNIVVQPDGSVKILELGLADALPRDTVLALAAANGTDAYLAPELKNRFMEGDARADVYSLGVVLYEMLTGRLPEADPVPPSEAVMGVPPAMDKIVLQCLRRRPEERPKTARRVERALRHALLPHKGYAPLWIAAAASLLLVGAAFVFLRPSTKAVEPPPVVVAKNEAPAPAPAPKAKAPAPVPAPTPVKKPVAAAAPKPKPAAPAPAAPKPAPAPAPKATEPPVPPPTPVAPVRAKKAAPPKPVEVASIEPRTVPAPSSNAGASPLRLEDLGDTPMARPVPPAARNEAPAPDVSTPAPPTKVRSAHTAALRARREAESVDAARNAPDDYKAALAALDDGDASVDSGWAEGAEQQYRKAERYFRSAIRQSMEPLRIPASVTQTQAPAPPQNNAQAHSLEFLGVVPGPAGDRVEIAFNLLGGGQRRQTFSVGDEIADGWRLESVDPSGSSIRVRAGNRTVTLGHKTAQP